MSSSFVACSFSAKQYPPSKEDVSRDDTDHWYIMIEPQNVQGTDIADFLLTLRLRDDRYANVSRVAQILDEQVRGLEVQR